MMKSISKRLLNLIKKYYLPSLWSTYLVTCQASSYPWEASFKARFQEKKGSQKETITVTNTYTSLTQLPIIIERRYSDKQADEYFALAPIDKKSYSQIINHPDNITQVKELIGIFNNEEQAKNNLISFYTKKISASSISKTSNKMIKKHCLASSSSIVSLLKPHLPPTQTSHTLNMNLPSWSAHQSIYKSTQASRSKASHA